LAWFRLTERANRERESSVAICVKSIYTKPEQSDGLRILVDRLWPRGMSKERLQLDTWLKELAPSHELRRWFGHDPEKWEEFRRRYCLELAAQATPVEELLAKIQHGRVTLLFAASDQQHNNAVALRDFLERQMAP
jgi:uncharacterized protein YeaO (DUF488 family)